MFLIQLLRHLPINHRLIESLVLSHEEEEPLDYRANGQVNAEGHNCMSRMCFLLLFLTFANESNN